MTEGEVKEKVDNERKSDGGRYQLTIEASATRERATSAPTAICAA
jgi:GH18 family chitinase